MGQSRETAGFSIRRRVRSGSLEMTMLILRGDPASDRCSSAQDDRLADFPEGAVEERNQEEQEGDLVELGGVARDAVAEVDGPGEAGGRAVGVVGEAGEEASDAADGDAKGERDGVEVTGGVTESDIALDEFDGDQAASEGADDGFASDEGGGVVEVVQSEGGIFEPVEELGAERGSGDGGGEGGPAKRRGDGVSEAAAELEIDAEADNVGEGLEKKMGVDAPGAEVEIERERGGMGRVEDGEL